MKKHMDDNDRAVAGILPKDPADDAHPYSVELAGASRRKAANRTTPATARPSAGNGERLEVKASTRIDLMNAAVLTVLARDDVGTYQRSRRLVRIVRERLQLKWAKNKPVALHISPFLAPTLKECLAQHVSFTKSKKVKGKDGEPGTWQTREIEAPPTVISALLAREEYPGVRILSGIAEAPALRPDGTVLQGETRYDEATGLYFEPSEDFDVILDTPTLDDAKKAAGELLEVVKDFPFASEAHRAAWLASVLTCFARPAIEGPCPFMAYDATTRGTGKSLLADATTTIALGREAPKYAQPADDEEMRKRITAIVMSAEPIVVLDNIDAPLKYPSLDGLMTTTQWADRELGVTGILRGEARAMWIGTGNNLVLGGDLARRTLHVRLESMLENPEDRDDLEHPQLLQWVRQERARLVVAALTMLRAFVVAGRPTAGVKPWGSFIDWSSLVGSCVAWVGLPDPTSTRTELERNSDEGKASLIAILDLWERMGGERGLTVAAVLKNLYGAASQMERVCEPDWYPEAREAIEAVASAPNGKPSPKKLGWFLKRSRKRVVGGRWLEEAGTTRTNSVLWTIRSAA